MHQGVRVVLQDRDIQRGRERQRQRQNWENDGGEVPEDYRVGRWVGREQRSQRSAASMTSSLPNTPTWCIKQILGYFYILLCSQIF